VTVRAPVFGRGDTIAVVSTSWGGAGLLGERFARGIEALAKLGYRVKVMSNARAVSDGVRDWVAGGRDARLADLHDAFADLEVRCVLSAIGGNHSAQLLEGLDLDLIREHPKLVCGYSDTTTLLLALHARTGLVTIYGPALLPEFGEIAGPDPEVVDWFERVASSTVPAGALPRIPWQAVEDRAVSDAEGRARRRKNPEPRLILRGGAAQGRLLVGCLPSIRTLIGTPWEPDWKGALLVIETPESPYDPAWADADLAHLRNAGILASIAGLAVGRTDGWSQAEQAQLHACVLDSCRDYDYPVVAGIECSHAAPLLALPIGVAARLDGDQLIIEEAAVRCPTDGCRTNAGTKPHTGGVTAGQHARPLGAFLTAGPAREPGGPCPASRARSLVVRREGGRAPLSSATPSRQDPGWQPVSGGHTRLPPRWTSLPRKPAVWRAAEAQAAR
jgi:muramoyltetrapeptide carboxypeptidase LdcA involved in peptidoglycan recycling